MKNRTALKIQIIPALLILAVFFTASAFSSEEPLNIDQPLKVIEEIVSSSDDDMPEVEEISEEEAAEFPGVKPGVSVPDAKIVYVVPIKNMIEMGLVSFIRRSFKEAEEAGADFVILDLDTPGGMVWAAEDITSMIYDYDIPVIAYVNRQAISAGAWIAISADAICMDEHATMGDIEPVPYSEKVATFIRAQLRKAAARKGRNPLIAEGMVDKEMAILEIMVDGEKRIVTDAEKENLLEAGKEVEQIREISPRYKLITLNTKEAVDLKYCEKTVTSLNEVISYADADPGKVKIVKISETPAETVGRFFSKASMVLLSLGVLSIFIAFYTQQYGLAGLGGVLLLLGLWGQYIAGLAGLEDFIIILIGLILIGIEIFVTPGFGAFGIVGIILLIIGMFLAMIDIDIVNPLSDPFLYQKLSAAVTRLGYSLLMALILGFVMMRYIVPRAFWSHIALHEKEDIEKGYHSSERDFESYIGRTGTAVTDLHPTGIARFGTERLDVVSPGNYIDRGAKIKIVKQEGRRLIVKEIKDSDQPEPNNSNMEELPDNPEVN